MVTAWGRLVCVDIRLVPDIDIDNPTPVSLIEKSLLSLLFFARAEGYLIRIHFAAYHSLTSELASRTLFFS